MINVAELITDPDFAQTLLVTRTGGDYNTAGVFETSEETFSVTGVMTPANAKEQVSTPNGDMVTGDVNFYTLQPLFVTQLNADLVNEGVLSDTIAWHDQEWILINTKDYSDYGYHKSVAIRKEGA